MSDEIQTTDTTTAATETAAPAPSMSDTMDRIAAEIADREPVRGGDGKFQPKVVAEGTAPEGTEVPGSAQAAAPDPAPPVIEAPQSLPADVKAKWSTLPPEVQTYWSNRESEVHKKFTTDGERLKTLERFDEVLAPVGEKLKTHNIPAPEYMRRLVEADQLLTTNAPEGLRQVAAMYGVDLRQLLTGQPDPSSALNREVQDLRSELQTLKTNAEQAKLGAAQQVIDDFKKDKPHFDAVMPLMTTLMEGKQAKNLDEAYAMATKAHPEVSAKVAAEAEKKAAEDAVKAAKEKAAKDAKLTPFGKRPGSTPTGPVKGKNIWETMDRVATDIQSRT